LVHALESQRGIGFLLRVNRDDLRVGVSAGILAATATAGALIAIGNRASTPARPFNMIAGHLTGSESGDVYGFTLADTLTGVAIHIVLCVIAGIAVAFVARRRLAPAWAAALLISTLAALVSVGIARRGGVSLARLLAIGDLLLFYLVLAIALVVGTRLAFFSGTSVSGAPTTRHIDPM
jgi:hypothetical protein